MCNQDNEQDFNTENSYCESCNRFSYKNDLIKLSPWNSFWEIHSCGYYNKERQ